MTSVDPIYFQYITYILTGVFTLLQLGDWFTTYLFLTHPQLNLIEANKFVAKIIDALTPKLGIKLSVFLGAGFFKLLTIGVAVYVYGFYLNPRSIPVAAAMVIASVGYTWVVVHNVVNINASLSKLKLTWANFFKPTPNFGV